MGVCERCKGAGYLTRDVAYGHPDFGRLFPCACKRAELKARREAKARDASNLIGQLLHKMFENYTPQDSLNREALRVARAFAAEPHGWLVLVGGNGRGKTHLAAAIANYRLKRNQPVIFVVVPDLLDRFRSTFRPGATTDYDEQFELVRTHPLLILDDLGAESATSWAREKLFQILNYRYNALLPTVITSDVAIDDWDVRIRARFQDTDVARIVRVDTSLTRLDVPTWQTNQAGDVVRDVARNRQAWL